MHHSSTWRGRASQEHHRLTVYADTGSTILSVHGPPASKRRENRFAFRRELPGLRATDAHVSCLSFSSIEMDHSLNRLTMAQTGRIRQIHAGALLARRVYIRRCLELGRTASVHIMELRQFDHGAGDGGYRPLVITDMNGSLRLPSRLCRTWSSSAAARLGHGFRDLTAMRLPTVAFALIGAWPALLMQKAWTAYE